MRKLLEGSKYLSLIAIVSLLFSAAAAFLWGAAKTYQTVVLILISFGEDPAITTSLIELVDAFLLATALLIFAVSLYELFIGKINLPEWMLAHNLHELKAKLSSVIILVMAVKFLEKLVEAKDAQSVLFTAIAVAAVAAVLIAFSHFGGKD